MKQILRFATKITLHIVSLLLILLILIGGFYGIKGYQMYRDAIEDTPISDMVSTVHKSEHFTSYFPPSMSMLSSLPRTSVSSPIQASTHWQSAGRYGLISEHYPLPRAEVRSHSRSPKTSYSPRKRK